MSKKAQSDGFVLTLLLVVVGLVAVGSGYILLRAVFDTGALKYAVGINYFYVVFYIIAAILLIIAGLVAIVSPYFYFKK